MKKNLPLGAVIFFLFCLTGPIWSISSAETSGLGSLSLELEYGRTFQTPATQTILSKIVHGLSNQVDIKIILGSFGIEGTSGFIYGAGCKWGLLQETHAQPAVSLNLEYIRGSYVTTIPQASAYGDLKVDSSFFMPTILVSKNLIWWHPFLEAGVNLAAVRITATSSGEVLSNIGGSSSAWFVGLGSVFEFDIIQLTIQGLYDFDTPMAESAFKIKAGFNMLL